jgi:tetratricopeptide (TPR) repeat protein
MLERLERQLDLLVSRRRDLPSRQQSLRATIQWSYDLLSPALQGWFARLGVFRGGWTIEAAEAVCSNATGNALLMLSELQEHSLIVAEERGSAASTGEGGPAEPGTDEEQEIRYRMLEPLREFALEKLTPEERAALDRRHARFFAALAEQAKVNGSERGEEVELARLEREHENVRVALEWSLSAAGDLPLGLALGAALGWFWQAHNYFREGREYLTRLLDRARQAEPPVTDNSAFVRAGIYAARFMRFQGDSSAARLLLEESLCLARALGDAAQTATALCELALFFQRDPQVKRAMCEESLALFRALGDQRSVGQVLVSLGTGCYEDDLPRARALCQEGLAVFRQLGVKTPIAWCLVHLGDLAYLQGDYPAARSHAEESLALFQAVGDRLGMSCSLNRLGRLALVAGRHEQARFYQEQALEIARELGAPRDMAWILTHLGDIAQAEGDRTRAAACYEQVLEICHLLADRWQGSHALIGLAGLAEQESRWEQAAALFAEILTLGQERQRQDAILIGLEGLARQAAHSGNFERGAELLAAAAAQRQISGEPMSPEAQSACERAITLLRAGLGEAWFETAWASGQALSLEQAAVEALGDRG